MNNAATNLLRSLDQLGVQALSFKILGLRRGLRHTAPVTAPTGVAASFPISVTDVFTAYALTPRQGAYELNVANGCLTFVPAAIGANALRPRTSVLKKRRMKAKASLRGLRTTFPATPHKIAA